MNYSNLYVYGNELALVKEHPELAHLKARIVKEYDAEKAADIKLETNDRCGWSSAYNAIKNVEIQIKKEKNKKDFDDLAIGDGVTFHGYSDKEAYTVISRTKSKVIAQMDKATIDPSFRPDFVSGGFVAHCTNQSEQTYTYEPDPNGSIMEITFSKKDGRMYSKGTKSMVTLGRRKFYDYNF